MVKERETIRGRESKTKIEIERDRQTDRQRDLKREKKQKFE